MVNENKIRDLLALNLELLEPGLVHIETEHKLPNLHGSWGSIDILARDAVGHSVIIELKRSDSSARSAYSRIVQIRCTVQDGTWTSESSSALLLGFNPLA